MSRMWRACFRSLYASNAPGTTSSPPARISRIVHVLCRWICVHTAGLPPQQLAPQQPQQQPQQPSMMMAQQPAVPQAAPQAGQSTQSSLAAALATLNQSQLSSLAGLLGGGGEAGTKSCIAHAPGSGRAAAHRGSMGSHACPQGKDLVVVTLVLPFL